MPDPDKPRSRSPAGKGPPSRNSKQPRKPAMNESEPTKGVFNLERLRQLVELMKEHDLSEVDLRESRQQIRICRGPKEPPRAAYGPPPPPPPPSAPGSGPATSKAAPAD